jgi:hypothetical protein
VAEAGGAVLGSVAVGGAVDGAGTGVLATGDVAGDVLVAAVGSALGVREVEGTPVAQPTAVSITNAVDAARVFMCRTS